MQRGAQGGEGDEARERPHQTAPVSSGPGHLSGGLAERHDHPGGGGPPNQEEAGAHNPSHAAPVSPPQLLVLPETGLGLGGGVGRPPAQKGELDHSQDAKRPLPE